MDLLVRMIRICFSCLIPKSLRARFIYCTTKIKAIMTNPKELKIFWKVLGLLLKVVLYPVALVVSFVLAFLQSIVVLVMPQKRYAETAYNFHEFYKDMVQRSLGLKLSFKRVCLRNELFTKGCEKKKSYGNKNADKTFFVIRPYYFMEANELATTVSNLLFHYYRCLQHLTYAINNDYIPVVDWRNYGPFPHQEETPINGTTDCWEYFWKQPSEYTLEEVYESKNVILSDQNTRNYGYIPEVQFRSPFASYAKRLAVTCPEYADSFEFNDVTKEYFQQKIEEVFPKDERILGVCVRAMSYGSSAVKNHPIQPAMEQLIELIEQKMEEWELGYCFVTCESQLVIDELKEKFGDKLIFLPRLRYTYKPTSEDNVLYEDGQKYKTNLDYLTEMYMLSKCTSIIGGMNSGMRAAIIWNADCYEHMYIFDKGNW